MLKRNLFAIVMTSLVLIFTSNAFGQWTPDDDKILKITKRKAPKISKISKTKVNNKVTINSRRLKANRIRQQPSGLITEIGFPSAIKSNSSKSKGYIGETEKNLVAKRKPLKAKVKNEDIEVEKDETHRTKH